MLNPEINLPFDTTLKQETVSIKTQTRELRFPVFYGLRVLEQININKALMELSPYAMACELAVKIESELQMDLMLCYNAVVGNPPENKQDLLEVQRIRIRYAREIEKINNFSEEYTDQERLITVTEIYKRIDPNWTVEKTHMITVPLLQEIWKFAQSEIACNSGVVENIVPTKEDIKKPVDESPSQQIG
ncbi:hypothetical protein [Anabaena lutea]|uniref:Uncharacterized protein n=1 Tax=Anabaena lutea FACHB-196 TaxID=2692881 RepID=A0ABR8FIW1_9NOST|nr:hypothetical protein [Anabaena lutea]MBD2570049.1 hypothetical protein [Anabaena lutea FACHB-196]